jgi:hypothetical protein
MVPGGPGENARGKSMRLRLSGSSRLALPKWRENARRRLKFLKGSLSLEVRDCIAQGMESEALKRAYKEMGERSKAGFRDKERAYLDAKEDAIRKWKAREIAAGEIDDDQVTEMALRSSLRKVGIKVRTKVRSQYKQAKWKTVKVRGKSERVTTHYRERIRVGKHSFRDGRKLIPAATLKKKMALTAYWERVHKLAEALAITKEDGSLDLLRARDIDRTMLNVPDSVRRRIYDECVEKATKGYFAGKKRAKGVAGLPRSRREAKALAVGRPVGHGHGNRRG